MYFRNFLLLAVCLCLLPADARAQCYLSRYWPMNNGDATIFANASLGAAGNASLGVSTNDGGFILSQITAGGTVNLYLSTTNDQLLLSEINGPGIGTLNFNTALTCLTDTLLANGGSVTTSAACEVTGTNGSGTATVTLVATVAKTGIVTVPAGSYTNCVTLQFNLKTVGNAQTVQIPLSAFILAPGVGTIEQALYDYFGTNAALAGWTALTDGDVGGLPVASLAPASSLTVPAFTLQPKSTMATNFSSLTLKAVATGGAVQYQWLFNGQFLTNGGAFSGVTSSNLVINPVAYADTGAYSVAIVNAACSGVSTDAVLSVVADTIPPVLSITNPPAGLTVSNAAFTIKGTASDSIAVSNVLYSLNNTFWTSAGSANNWTNWSAPVTLVAGTNAIQAYAIDFSGNRSLTNSVKLTYVAFATLGVLTSGNGSFSPKDNGTLLQIGKNYTLTATAAAGWAFYNWTDENDAIRTNKATLTFTMSSNLVLTANFYQLPVIQSQPTNVVAFTGGNASFAVTATSTAPLGYQWQHSSANLSGQTGSSLALNSLVTANAGSYRVIVSAYSSSVTSSVVTLTLTNPPASLAGFDSVVTPAGQSSFQVSFGTNSFSEYSPSNYENSGAGSYKFVSAGGLSGRLSLTNLLPPEAVSNGTQTVPMTFVSPGLAVFINGNSSGTFQYFTATNLVPSVWKTNKLILTATNELITLSLTTTNAFYAGITNGTATATSAGTYTAASYSPVAGWLQFDATNEVTNYLQLQFTTKTNGEYIMETYDSSGNPAAELQGGFTWK
jgi:hypothetical protein